MLELRDIARWYRKDDAGSRAVDESRCMCVIPLYGALELFTDVEIPFCYGSHVLFSVTLMMSKNAFLWNLSAVRSAYPHASGNT